VENRDAMTSANQFPAKSRKRIQVTRNRRTDNGEVHGSGDRKLHTASMAPTGCQ
jgi:hypothetical protein